MTLRPITTRLVAAFTLAGAPALVALSQPIHAAATPTHVAIAVDFGNRVSTACVPAGGNGSAVLGADFRVVYNKTGLVVQINGVGTVNPAPDLYWAYWHSSGGSWSYARTGPATFHPAAGTVEGWTYNDGGVGPKISPNYAAICGGQDPVPPPTHAATHTSTVRHQPSPPPAVEPGPPGHPTSPPPARAGDAHSSASTPAAGRRATSSTKRQSSSAGTGSSSASTEPSDSSSWPGANQSAVQLVGAKQADKHASTAPAVGTALGLLAVAGLGGAAFWRLRRQKLG